jgi:hypothetical protein
MVVRKRKSKAAPDEGEGRFRTRREIRIERFIIEQIDEYIRLHKEHEKDINYIG